MKQSNTDFCCHQNNFLASYNSSSSLKFGNLMPIDNSKPQKRYVSNFALSSFSLDNSHFCLAQGKKSDQSRLCDNFDPILSFSSLSVNSPHKPSILGPAAGTARKAMFSHQTQSTQIHHSDFLDSKNNFPPPSAVSSAKRAYAGMPPSNHVYGASSSSLGSETLYHSSSTLSLSSYSSKSYPYKVQSPGEILPDASKPSSASSNTTLGSQRKATAPYDEHHNAAHTLSSLSSASLIQPTGTSIAKGGLVGDGDFKNFKNRSSSSAMSPEGTLRRALVPYAASYSETLTSIANHMN